LIPYNETGCAPLNPSCTITSVAIVPVGTLSTVICCVLIGSAVTTLVVTLAATFRLVVNVVS